MELKPLYLAAGRRWCVSHEERALRVDRIGRAPAWYPFRRLDRVISAIDVEWRSESLIACLRAGVPVSFLDGHGRPQGFCYGVRKREATLDQLLHIAFDHPEWDVRYRHWRNGIVRQELLTTQAALRVTLRQLDPALAHSTFCNRHYLRVGRPPAPLLRALDGAIHALVAAHLAGCVSPQWLGHPRPGLCLVTEFAQMLRWVAHRAVHNLHRDSLPKQDPAHTAAVLLATTPDVSHTLAQLIHRFELWLRDWSNEPA